MKLKESEKFEFTNWKWVNYHEIHDLFVRHTTMHQLDLPWDYLEHHSDDEIKNKYGEANFRKLEQLVRFVDKKAPASSRRVRGGFRKIFFHKRRTIVLSETELIVLKYLWDENEGIYLNAMIEEVIEDYGERYTEEEIKKALDDLIEREFVGKSVDEDKYMSIIDIDEMIEKMKY